MTEGALPVGSSDQFLDTTKVVHESGRTAHREGVFVGDPDTTANRADVGKVDDRLLYGMTVREMEFQKLLFKIDELIELSTVMIAVLQEAFNADIIDKEL